MYIQLNKWFMCLEKVTLINKDECGDVDISEETAKSVNYKSLFHSSQKPTLELAARTFIQSQYLKALAASLRVGFCDEWKRGFRIQYYYCRILDSVNLVPISSDFVLHLFQYSFIWFFAMKVFWLFMFLLLPKNIWPVLVRQQIHCRLNKKLGCKFVGRQFVSCDI